MTWSKWSGVKPIDADEYLRRVQQEDECNVVRAAERIAKWDEHIDRRDDLAHEIREAWKAPGVIRYDTDDEWRMAVAAADVALGRLA